MNKKRLIIRLILLIIFFGVGVWAYVRWNVWFGTQPDTDYAPTFVPDRVTMVPGTDFTSERIFSWRCDTVVKPAFLMLVKPEGDTVRYAASKSCVIINEKAKDAFYRVKISNLKKGQTYRYRTVTGNVESPEFTFTMPEEGTIDRMLFVGDIQDTVGGRNTQAIQKILAENPGVDLIVFAGDLLEGPVDKYWRHVYNSIDTIMATVPVVVAPGNHEYRKDFPPKLDPRWRRIFAYDYSGTAPKYGNYYISSDNVLIAVVDTQSLVYLYTIFQQMQWLKKLFTSQETDGKIKIVVMHHPPFSVRENKNNIVEKKLFAPMFKNLGIDFVLSGHEHGYGRFDQLDGPTYIVAGMSYKTYATRNPEVGEVVLGGRKTYQIVDFEKDRINYKSIDLETDEIIDNFSKINKTK